MKSSISFKYIVTGCFLSLTLPMEMRLGGKGRVIVPSMQRTIISKKLRPNPTNIPIPFHHIFVHQSPFPSRITLSKYVSGYRKRWQDYSDGTYKSNILTIERQLLFVLFSVKPKFLGVLNLPTSFHMSRLFFCMRGKNARSKIIFLTTDSSALSQKFCSKFIPRISFSDCGMFIFFQTLKSILLGIVSQPSAILNQIPNNFFLKELKIVLEILFCCSVYYFPQPIFVN